MHPLLVWLSLNTEVVRQLLEPDICPSQSFQIRPRFQPFKSFMSLDSVRKSHTIPGQRSQFVCHHNLCLPKCIHYPLPKLWCQCTEFPRHEVSGESLKIHPGDHIVSVFCTRRRGLSNTSTNEGDLSLEY